MSSASWPWSSQRDFHLISWTFWQLSNGRILASGCQVRAGLNPDLVRTGHQARLRKICQNYPDWSISTQL